MDTIDVVLAVVKFVGIVASAGFGLVGIVYDFRDKSGKITKSGHCALIGVLVSALISISSQSLEVLKTRNDARDASDKASSESQRSQQLLRSVDATAKRTEVAIREITRSLEPVYLDEM